MERVRCEPNLSREAAVGSDFGLMHSLSPQSVRLAFRHRLIEVQDHARHSRPSRQFRAVQAGFGLESPYAEQLLRGSFVFAEIRQFALENLQQHLDFIAGGTPAGRETEG